MLYTKTTDHTFTFKTHFTLVVTDMKTVLTLYNPTKWPNSLKLFVGNSRRIVWVCLTILWGWNLKA